jgi:prephenate dehydrogenase
MKIKQSLFVMRKRATLMRLEWVKHMYTKIGMRLLEMEADAHDLHAAYVSHISHITSFALANTVLEKEKEQKRHFRIGFSGLREYGAFGEEQPGDVGSYLYSE